MFAVFLPVVLMAGLLGGIERETVVQLGEAENQVFTPDGRHFVSSGIGLFEVTATETGFKKTLVGLDDCGVNGLAILDGYLIAACNRGELFDAEHLIFAGRLAVGAEPELELLFDLPNFFIANGVAISPAGAILVADFPIFGFGEVARIEVVEVDDTLEVVGYDPDFLTLAEQVEAPNGLKVRGRELFISDNGRVLKVELGAADEYLGTAVIYSRETVFDDLTLLCGGIVVTDFRFGGLIFIDPAGRPFETRPGLFEVPSSVAFGRPPLYHANDLLVTERGVLGDPKSDIGNRLTRVALPVELLRTFCGLGV